MRKIVILIDGENSGSYIHNAMSFISTLGKVIINRVYGDISILDTPAWRELNKQYKIEPRPTYVHTKKSNASDIYLSIEAINILRDKDFDTIVLLSSDSDFGALVKEFTSYGKEVIGIGKNDSNEYYKELFDEFHYYDELKQRMSTTDESIDSSVVETTSLLSSDKVKNSNVDILPTIDQINDICVNYINNDLDDDRVKISVLQELVTKIFPKVTCSEYGHSKFWKVLNECKNLNIVQNKKNIRFAVLT